MSEYGWKITFLLSEVLYFYVIFFFLLELFGLEFQVFFVDLFDLISILDFQLSPESLFFLFFSDGSFGPEPQKFAFFHFLPHFLNVLLFDLLVLLPDSFFEIFKLFFLLLLFSSFLFILFLDYFLK